MKCAHCGSPLRVKDGRAFADCEYCGHSTRIRSAQTLAAEAASRRPLKSVPLQATPRDIESRGRLKPKRASRDSPKRSIGSSCSGFIGLVAVFLSMAPFYYMDGGERFRERFDISELPFVGANPPTLVLDSSEERTLEGVVDGHVRASDFAHQSCDGGFLRRAPDVRLQIIHEGVVQFNVEGPGDLTLVVRTSAGVWLCDDDGGQRVLPRIEASLPVGTHHVWVGRFSREQPLAYRLRISEDMPAPND